MKYIRKILGWLAVTTILWMVSLAFIQVVVRTFFDTGITWADVQLRQLVLLVALLGGMQAVLDDRHIRIDLVSHNLRGRLRGVVIRSVSAIAGIGAVYLSWISWGFVLSERSGGAVLRGVLFGYDMPQWLIVLTLPVSFLAMGAFFIMSALTGGDQRPAPGRGY